LAGALARIYPHDTVNFDCRVDFELQLAFPPIAGALPDLSI
jgi:hypothetical protein